MKKLDPKTKMVDALRNDIEKSQARTREMVDKYKWFFLVLFIAFLAGAGAAVIKLEKKIDLLEAQKIELKSQIVNDVQYDHEGFEATLNYKERADLYNSFIFSFSENFSEDELNVLIVDISNVSRKGIIRYAEEICIYERFIEVYKDRFPEEDLEVFEASIEILINNCPAVG